MQVTYKNSRQQEFCNLMQTMEDLKFRPADVARMLKKSQGAISQYISGTTNPSETVLELFRGIVAAHTKPDAEVELTETSIREQLSDLHRYPPGDYEVVKKTITLLHQKLPMELKAGTPTSRLLKKAASGVIEDSKKVNSSKPGNAALEVVNLARPPHGKPQPPLPHK